MTTLYFIPCNVCKKDFRSRKALERHAKRHPGYDINMVRTKFHTGNQQEVDIPAAEPLKGNLDKYYEWLGDLVEGINTAHHPKVPGNWYRVTLTSVPQEYFSHLLHDLKSAAPNIVKEVRHLRPPVWRNKVLKVSYKTTVEEDVCRAFNQSPNVDLIMKKAFSGEDEVHTVELFGREALQAAKNPTSNRRKTTMRSNITIGEGQGRATRECELIWWPLYGNSKNGNFTVRLYIGKV